MTPFSTPTIFDIPGHRTFGLGLPARNCEFTREEVEGAQALLDCFNWSEDLRSAFDRPQTVDPFMPADIDLFDDWVSVYFSEFIRNTYFAPTSNLEATPASGLALEVNGPSSPPVSGPSSTPVSDQDSALTSDLGSAPANDLESTPFSSSSTLASGPSSTRT